LLLRSTALLLVADRLVLGMIGAPGTTQNTISNGRLIRIQHEWDCGCRTRSHSLVERLSAWTLCRQHELTFLGANEAPAWSAVRDRFKALAPYLHLPAWSAPLIGIGVAFGVKVAYDAKALAKRAEEAEDAALVDALTGLYNRRGWTRRVDEERKRLKRDTKAGVAVAVYMLDVDGLKKANDERGHAAGDAILRHVSKVIESVTREHDITARLGGDEFAIMTIQSQAAEADLIRARLERGFHSAGLAVSIGFAFAESLDTINEAMDRADSLMYEAKKNNVSRVAKSG
jgi:diguanylate cyclase (GGDEF)-like protein